MFVIGRDNLVVPFVFNLYVYWIFLSCAVPYVYACAGVRPAGYGISEFGFPRFSGLCYNGLLFSVLFCLEVILLPVQCYL